MLQGVATDLIDEKLPHTDARKTYSSPVSACPSVGTTEINYFSCSESQLSLTWGRLAPHMTIFPGLALMLVVFGFNVLGDGLRDAMDPRLKGRS